MAADPHQAARAAAMQDETQAQLQSLARKLLDLWQDHVSALAQDPALMGQALKLMAAYSPFPWPPAGSAPTGGTGFAPFPAGQVPFGFPAAGFQGGSPAGAASAAAAPDAGANAVGELRRRLAELEGRLAELEGGAGKPAAGEKPAKPARKRARRPGARPAKGG